MTAPVPGSLSGLKVIEFAAIGPVPFAAMMLADMGAQVTRIDRVPRSPDDPSAYSGFENRGRTSVAVNLKNPQGVDTVLRLIERCDVVLEGFRPGVMEKLGLGPETCQARNPRLIYGRMTGWGQHGPLAHAAGHDLNYIALSGALHAMGWADRPPSPPLNMVGDYGGGAMMLLVGVLSALFERERSGRGQVIDAAMTDGTATLMAQIYSLLAQGLWKDQRASNTLDGGAHYYGCYECADGRYVSVGSLEPQFYALLLEKCGIEDPEFCQQTDATRWAPLRARLESLFRTRTRAQWCELMEGSDVCFAPVLSMSEAPQHPHNRERGAFVELNGHIQPAPAPRFSRTPSAASAQIPREGEQTLTALTAIGMTEAEIERLLDIGAIYAAPRPTD